MIRVCDAIMGTGKTSATIRYLNEHQNQRFIYITPYLEEAKRIRDNCPALGFVEPKQMKQNGYSKLAHTQSLIEEGRNVTTTHQAFKNYSEEMLEAIRRYEYTLIIDENVDVLETCDIHEDDIQLAVDAGYIKYEDGQYSLLRNDYNGVAMKEMFWLLRSRQITRIDTEEKDDEGKRTRLYYWVLPPELLTSFKDVFILTYLFEGQSLHSFLNIYNLQYSYIGIEKIGETQFRFCDYPGYTPEYVTRIHEMIEIVDNDKLNAIGDSETALSKSWFEKNKRIAVQQLQNNIYNVFRHFWKDSVAEKRIWSTYKVYKDSLKGKGYTNGFAVLNLKASNEYRNREYLVYACNLFMNVNEKKYYYVNGIEVDEDKYALSIMVQWIWRSAIRDGHKIYIYLPSKRMRRILTDWMDSLTKGGCANEK